MRSDSAARFRNKGKVCILLEQNKPTTNVPVHASPITPQERTPVSPRNILTTFLDAFITKNIVLVQAIGLCPVVMAGDHLKLAVALTVCTGLVLITSALVMSLFGDRMAAWLRPPVYTLSAAVLLTSAGFIIERYISGDLFASLEIFLPLIAVNTLISYRAGGFAVANHPVLAVTDSIASTMGFGLVICAIALLRELASFGTIWDIPVRFMPHLLPAAAMPYAAFIMLGFMAAFIQWVKTAVSEAYHRRKKEALK